MHAEMLKWQLLMAKRVFGAVLAIFQNIIEQALYYISR
jgi:hypothetical protein